MIRRGPILAALGSAVVAALVLLVLVLPKMHQVSQARTELDQARTQQQTLENQLALLEQAKQEAPKIHKELAKLSTEIPPTADLPGMIQLVADAADRSAVDFFTIGPATPTSDASGTFSIIPTAITVNCGFLACDEFLFRLESLPRAVKVISITVAPGPGFTEEGPSSPHELAIQMSAEFYTTDSSAGPGSVPGATTGVAGAPAPPAITPAPASPTPGA